MPPKRKKDVAIDVDDGEKNYFIIFFSIEVSYYWNIVSVN